MVVKTKSNDNQFVNLITRAKNLAKTDLSEFIEVLREDEYFNLRIDSILREILSMLKGSDKNRDIRLFANNPHLLALHDEILENLVFDIDYRFFNSKTIIAGYGRDHRYLLEIKKLKITGVPKNINKKLYYMLNKKIKKIEAETTYIFNNLINTEKASVELNRDETIRRISKYLIKKMSVLNLFDIDENFKFKEVSFHIDTFGKFCVYGGVCSSEIGTHKLSLSKKKSAKNGINKNFIKMLSDRYGEGYENILVYYAKLAKADSEEYYKRLLTSDDYYGLKDVVSKKQPLCVLSDNRLKSDLSSESCMIRLKDFIRYEDDPIQKQRFIRAVSEILEEMKDDLPF